MVSDEILKHYLQIVSSLKEEEGETDSERCLCRILEWIPYREKRTIRELVEGVSKHSRNSEPNEILQRNGMKVTKDGYLFIKPNHSVIHRIMIGTDWEGGCKESLLNYPGAEWTVRKLSKNNNQRGVIMPLSAIFLKDEDREESPQE